MAFWTNPEDLEPGERIRGYEGQRLRARRLARTDGLCEMCKAEGFIVAAVEVDHIKPLDHGGLDVDENTRNLCKEHHDQVTREAFGHRVKAKVGADGWHTKDCRCISCRPKAGVNHGLQ